MNSKIFAAISSAALVVTTLFSAATPSSAAENSIDNYSIGQAAEMHPNYYIEPFPGGYYVRDMKRDLTGRYLIDNRNYIGINKDSYNSCMRKYGTVHANGRYIILYDSKVQQRHIYTHIAINENFRCSWVGNAGGGMSLEPA